MFTAETSSALVAVVCGLCACQDQPLNRSPRSGYLGVHGERFCDSFCKNDSVHDARCNARCAAMHTVCDTCCARCMHVCHKLCSYGLCIRHACTNLLRLFLLRL